MRSEAAGLEPGSGDVVGQVPEAQGGAAEVFEPAVDGLGRSVAGAGSAEEGQHDGGALLERPAGRDEGAGNAAADRLDQLLHQLPAGGAVGFAVGVIIRW